MFRTSCRRARGLFSLHLDDRVSPEGERFLSDHLACCPNCSERFADLRSALARVRSLETLEPDSDYEATILAALPAPIRAEESPAGPIRPRGGVRILPSLGFATAAALALVAGFLLRDLLPLGDGQPETDPSRLSSTLDEEIGPEIARDLASVRGSLMDHLNSSRDIFFQVASLQGQAPRAEVSLARSELDYSRIEPRTRRLRRVVPAVDLKKKDEVLGYLDLTARLVGELRVAVESKGASQETVVHLRHTVLDSHILDTIDDLSRSFAAHAIPVVPDPAPAIGASGGHDFVSIEDADYELYRRAKALFLARDYAGALRCLDRHTERFPSSPFRNAADYFRCVAAMRNGDFSRAVDGIKSSGRRILSGEGKADRVGRQMLFWAGSLDPMAVELVELGHEAHGPRGARKKGTFVAGSSSGNLFHFSLDGGQWLPSGSVIFEVRSGSEEGRLIRLEDQVIELEKFVQFSDYYPEHLEIRLECGAKVESGGVKFLFDPPGRGIAVHKDPRVRKTLESLGLDLKTLGIEVEVPQSRSRRRK